VTTLPRVGLLRACADPGLFGLDPWPKQRELLASVEHGPRLHVWCLGRRSGKSTSGALIALWSCLLRPELLERLRPGERGYAVGIAPNLRQARLLIRAALSIVERSPLLAGMVEQATQDEIRFANGTSFVAFPNSSRGARGWPIFTLILDEAAFFIADEHESFQTAEEVWRSLVPATAQFGNEARLVVSSTPYGADGFFPGIYQQAASGELPDALAFHAPTREANPTLDESFFAQEERRDPDGFRAEYLAEFVGSGAAFFDPDNIKAAVTLSGELRPGDAVDWIAGLDPGFAQDPFALVLVGRADVRRDPAGGRRLLVGLVRSWLPPRRKAASLEEGREIEDTVLAEVAQMIRLFDARAVTDQYKSAGVVDRLRRYGVSVVAEPMTAPTKDAAFGFLRGRLNDGSIELYEHPELQRELRAIRTRYAAGRSSVVTPRIGRGHCDLAQALAIACFGHDRSGLGGGDLTAWLDREPGWEGRAVTEGLWDKPF
jgi:hypothetical protein